MGIFIFIISGDDMEYEMSENVYRPRERRTENRGKEEKNEKKDFLTSVIITQIIVFTVIGVVFFFLYKSDSETYTELKTIYNEIMRRDMTAEEIKDAVKSAMQFITEPQTAESALTDGGDNGGQAAVNDEEEPTYIDELLTEAAGGEDLMYAGENTSFAPLYLSVPIVKPVDFKRVSSSFGYRVNPVTDEYGFHTGLDLAADEGTDIKAAFNGTVEVASYSNGRGNYLIITSAGGITTVYCHCSELIAEQGANVKAGEVIAKVGSTGQATGPHLHFEVKVNGVYYNPAWVIKT